MSQTYISVMQGSGGVASEGPTSSAQEPFGLVSILVTSSSAVASGHPGLLSSGAGSASVSRLILVQPASTHHPPLHSNAAGWNPIPFTFLYLGKLVILQLCIRAKASRFFSFFFNTQFYVCTCLKNVIKIIQVNTVR